MTSFADALKEKLQFRSDLTFRERHIARFLDSPDSEHKRRKLERMEAASRAAIGAPADGELDWQDWLAKWLPTILGIVGLLLMFLGEQGELVDHPIAELAATQMFDFNDTMLAGMGDGLLSDLLVKLLNRIPERIWLPIAVGFIKPKLVDNPTVLAIVQELNKP